MKMFKSKCKKSGFTLIEMLVLLAVFSIITLAFYQAFAVASRYIFESRNRLQAIALANEKVETLRNLAYADVAIQGGIPSGNIDPDEYYSSNGRTYHIYTDIRYYDDPDDGTFGGSPNDPVPNDNKIVEVKVAWGEEIESQSVVMVTRFVPPGIENPAGGGVLSINAIDYTGNPVPDVSIHLVNDNIDADVDYSTQTDSNGNLMLQGVPGDTELNYELTLSKDDYETVETFPPYPQSSFEPEDEDFSVIAGDINTKVVEINKTSDINITVLDPFGQAVSGVKFNLTGGRNLSISSSAPEYNCNEDFTSDSSGEADADDISGGGYAISLISPSTDSYDFWKIDPNDSISSSEFVLGYSTEESLNMIVMDESLDSVIVRVASDENVLIEGADVQLKNETLGYDVTRQTDKYGMVFFPENLTVPLQEETYNVKVSADGYSDNETTVSIDGLSHSAINLNPN